MIKLTCPKSVSDTFIQEKTLESPHKFIAIRTRDGAQLGILRWEERGDTTPEGQAAVCVALESFKTLIGLESTGHGFYKAVMGENEAFDPVQKGCEIPTYGVASINPLQFSKIETTAP